MKNVLRTFVLHVSIAKPLGESGMLQLTGDMTELEFALSAFISDGNSQSGKSGVSLDAIGEDYRALRAMRYLFVFISVHEFAADSTRADPFCFLRTRS